MRKDRSILLLLLTAFVLLGADCQAPWDKDDVKDRPLPDRAVASSSLLRAYYNTRTFPEEMRSLKIPENGSNAQDEDDQLDIEFSMGSATVSDVRVHWYIIPPPGKTLSDVELLCRLVAPNGSASAWKQVNAGTGADFNPHIEVSFLYEFDGLDSAGTWHAQIRDSVADADGRCLFRNASLHINLGEPAGGGAGSASANLDLNTGNYGTIPEANGERESFDIGWFGIGRMLANEFTILPSFSVASATVTVSLYIPSEVNPSEDLWFLLVAPSGNWYARKFSATPEVNETTINSDLKLATYVMVVDSTPNGLLMNLNGEPSAGTWTLYLVDTNKDNHLATVTNDRSGGTNPASDTGRLQLDLAS